MAGGEEMIDNRLQFTDAVTKAEYITTANPGLVKKIKPLDLRYVSKEYWNAVEENRAKLNEVIEAVNKMMEVMNERVK
jgi:hypothetical protein